MPISYCVQQVDLERSGCGELMSIKLSTGFSINCAHCGSARGLKNRQSDGANLLIFSA